MLRESVAFSRYFCVCIGGKRAKKKVFSACKAGHAFPRKHNGHHPCKSAWSNLKRAGSLFSYSSPPPHTHTYTQARSISWGALIAGLKVHPGNPLLSEKSANGRARNMVSEGILKNFLDGSRGFQMTAGVGFLSRGRDRGPFTVFVEDDYRKGSSLFILVLHCFTMGLKVRQLAAIHVSNFMRVRCT